MSIYKKTQGKKLSIEVINQRIKHKNIELVGNFENVMKETTFKCINFHTWVARPHNIMNGRGCPICFRNSRKFSKQIIEEKIKKFNIELEGEYLGYHKKTLFKCLNGHSWICKPANIFSGKGCPSCRKYGFNILSPAYLYILKFSDFLKYGITNNLSSRLYSHRKHNGEYEILFTRFYDHGIKAALIESEIKKNVGGNFVNKSKCPDGFTETLPIEKLQDIFEIIKR